jgi:hypothetical protein
LLVLDTGITIWYVTFMQHNPSELTKKITVVLPADLVERATETLGKGNLTAALREALTEALRKESYKQLLAMRGKVDFGLTWQEIKSLDD